MLEKTTCFLPKTINRFWSKVEKGDPDECWNWTGTLNNGYGDFWAGNKRIGAHRYSWMLHNEEIPKNNSYHGLCVMHMCDNPACVNPAHLKLGTHQENMSDRTVKGRTGIRPANPNGKKRKDRERRYFPRPRQKI